MCSGLGLKVMYSVSMLSSLLPCYPVLPLSGLFWRSGVLGYRTWHELPPSSFTLFVKSYFVMWLSNRFSSYAAYIHECSVTKHEQHAFASPFSLTPHLLDSGSSNKESVFIPWKLFHTCEISQSGIKQLITLWCLLLCVLLWINWSSETEVKL